MWNVNNLGLNAGLPRSHFGMNSMMASATDNNENLFENAPFRAEPKRSQTVVPLCIKQITNYKDDDDFQLFGMPVRFVKVVAVLRKISMQSTQVGMRIEDHTGLMTAVLFIETISDQDNIPKNREGTYLQIYGSIRTQPLSNEKMLMVVKMLPVDNCNDITTHLLEVIHARFATESLLKKQWSTANSRADALTKTLNPDMDVDVAPVAVDACNYSHGLTEFQDSVFRILQAEDSFAGLHRNVIFNSFSVNQANDVKLALEKLLNEGFVYTTIDEEHYKAMDTI